jgi:hypothetical protein
MTAGVTLNIILKAGSSTPRGSGRIYIEDDSLQGTNISSSLATALGSPNGKGNRTSRYLHSGLELGTPIIKDRLWAWGSLARTDVTLLTIRQTPDETNLTNGALKVQARPARGVRAEFTHFYGNKVKHGRDGGATRPPETTYDQKGPSRFYKGEINAVIRDSLYLAARGSHFSTGFSLDPRGGMNKDVYRDDSGVWHGSYPSYASDRPQQTLIGEGSYFRGRHELKFAYSWRRATADTTSAPPSSTGSGIITYHVGYPELWVSVESPSATSARAVYQSAWVGDTMSLRRATVTAGVRYDGQSDGVLPSSVPAVKGFEAWLPALSGSALPRAIVWRSLSPRIGITFGLDETRRTQLRASYARFASHLANGASSIAAVGQSRYVAFYGQDANGDKIAQYNEIDFADGPAAWGGFSLDRPSSLTSVNEIGAYNVPRTHEVVVGVDHELVRDIGIRASLTWRRMGGFNWTPRIGVREPLYRLTGTLTAGPLPDTSHASTPVYAITADRVPAAALGGGTEYTARDGYHQRFWGFEASAAKRLSNRWMARLGVSTNDHREYFDDPSTSIEDPTPGPGSPNVDGGLVIVTASGSGRSGVYLLLPKYQVIANGLYQGPWGIDVGASLIVRQGFGQPWYRSSVSVPADYFSPQKNVALYGDIGENRLPTVTSLDLRVAKSLVVGKARLHVDLDAFNALNAATVLGRQYDYRLTGATGFNQVLDVMHPFIVRLGVRAAF